MKRTGFNKSLLLVSSIMLLSGCGKQQEPPHVDPPHEHSFSDFWESDETQHWHVSTCGHEDKKDLSNHEFGEFEITKPATENEAGIEFRACVTCAYIESRDIPKIDAPTHSHTFSEEWEKNETEHWHKSTCEHDLKNDVSKHKFGVYSVKQPATETENGIKERVCNVCGQTQEISYRYTNTADDPYPVDNYYNGYYSSLVSWENGEDLKDQLHALISNDFTGLTYTNNWETNQITEQSLTDFTKLDVVYSNKNDDKTNTYSSSNSNGWQREHALCASLMTGYNTGEAVNIRANGTSRATDFHNLFASYGAANGSRGNKNLGIYNPSDVQTDSKAVYADTNFDTKNYEPSDYDKGRMARAIFYMGVMYSVEETSVITITYKYKDENGTTRNKSVTINAKYKPISIVEEYVDYSQVALTDFISSDTEECQQLRDTYYEPYKEATNNSTAAYISTNPDSTVLQAFAKAYSDYRYNKAQFAIGNLSTLINWSTMPVDRQEMWHNEMVYSYVHTSGNNTGKKQGNRNPFVDYPELVEYIYGSKQNECGELGEIRPSADSLDTNSNELFGYAITKYKNEYLTGQTLTANDYTLVRVNKDFSIVDSDFENTNEPYTFVDSDIGEKTIELDTPTGKISYVVTVKSSGGVNACNYEMMVTKDVFSATTIQTTPTKMIAYGSVEYNVSAGVDACPIAKKDTYVQIGNGTAKVPNTVTIETIDPFAYDNKSQITSVYLGLNTASGCTYNYKISIGGEVVMSGTFKYNQGTPLIYGGELAEPKSGVLKIELSGCTKAVYISQISVNVI